MSRLAAKGIAVTPARIVDLTVRGARAMMSTKGALDVLTTAPEFGHGARRRRLLGRASIRISAVKPIIDSANRREADRRISGSRSAGRTGAIEQGRRCRPSGRRRPARTLSRPHSGGASPKLAIATPKGNSGRVLDEIAAYALLEPARPAALARCRARRDDRRAGAPGPCPSGIRSP